MRGFSRSLTASLNLLLSLFARMLPFSDTLNGEVFVSLVADVALNRETDEVLETREVFDWLRRDPLLVAQIVSFPDSAKSRTSKELSSIISENIFLDLLIFPFKSC